MKNRIVFLLFSFFCVAFSYAQTDFRPGYLITLESDTVSGEIDYRGDAVMSNICRFKNEQGKIWEYKANDIQAFRFYDSKYFVAHEVDGEWYFLEYLINGIISVYYMRNANADRYFIEKEGLGLKEISYKEYIENRDGKDYMVKTNVHGRFLSYYMQDAPELSKRIQNMHKPEHKNLINLAKDYHYSVCDDNACIVYEKKKPALKVNLEPVAGVMVAMDGEIFYVDHTETYEGGVYPLYGVNTYFWLPRTNEKLYLKIGLLFSHYTYEDEVELGISLPIHLAYIAPDTYKVRPTFSISLFSPSYTAGCMVKVHENMHLGIQGNVSFNSTGMIWIPSSLNAYAIYSSLYIQW